MSRSLQVVAYASVKLYKFSLSNLYLIISVFCCFSAAYSLRRFRPQFQRIADHLYCEILFSEKIVFIEFIDMPMTYPTSVIHEYVGAKRK